jgi:hypothetical protein
MLPDYEIRKNFYKVREICEQINQCLDNGYLVMNAEGEQSDPRYRFVFEEPDWNNLEDHCWFLEVCMKVSPTTTQGYFDPDLPLERHLEEWSKWSAIPPEAIIRFV